MPGRPRRPQSLRRLFVLSTLVSGAVSCWALAASANTPPHLDTNTPLVVLEGHTGTIGTSMLLVIDAESPNTQLTYTINPGDVGPATRFGDLKLSGSTLSSGSTFTQDDVDNGRLTYTHAGNEEPTDDFRFEVRDGDGALASDGPFTVFKFGIAITLVNDPPSPTDASYGVGIGATLTGTLGATDPDSPSLTFSIATNGTKGVAMVLNPATGAFSYTGNPGELGGDTFTFQVFDGTDYATAPGTISVDINNQPPTCLAGGVFTGEGSPVDGALSATDPDQPPQQLLYSIATNGTLGTATIVDPAAGTFHYVPNPGAFGTDSFTFQCTDGLAVSTPATMQVQIRALLQVGDIVVSSNDNSQVFLIDPATGQFEVVASGGSVQNPRGVKVESSGAIVAICPSGAANAGVVRVNPYLGSSASVSPGTNFTTSPLGSVGLAIEASGQLLVGDGTAGVIRVDPVSGATSTLSAGGSINLALDVTVATNGDIYVTDGSVFLGQSSRVVQVDPVTGSQNVVTIGGNLLLPAGIVVESSGMLVVSDVSTFAGGPADQIIRVDPISGAQTVLTSGGLLKQPTGIALDVNGDILIVNQGDGEVIRIDPVTGAQSVVFSNPALKKPFSITVVRSPTSTATPTAGAAPSRLDLASAAPNPVVSFARIDYALPHEAHVRLQLLDVTGRRVAGLVDRTEPSGRHSVVFDGRSFHPGMYFIRIEDGTSTRTRKLLIAR